MAGEANLKTDGLFILPMSYFILLRGPAGVGKTTVSKLLAEKLKAKVVHFDNVMRSLGLDYVPGDRWIPLEKFLQADARKLSAYNEQLQKGTPLIIEGNFYHQEHIADVIAHLHVPYYLFTLKADLQECMNRDQQRSEALGEQAITQVFRLVAAFEYGTAIATQGKTPIEVANEIIAYLPKKHVK